MNTHAIEWEEGQRLQWYECIGSSFLLPGTRCLQTPMIASRGAVTISSVQARRLPPHVDEKLWRTFASARDRCALRTAIAMTDSFVVVYSVRSIVSELGLEKHGSRDCSQGTYWTYLKIPPLFRAAASSWKKNHPSLASVRSTFLFLPSTERAPTRLITFHKNGV